MDMHSWNLFIPQRMDEVCTDVIRINAEIARFVRFCSSSEEWEVFEGAGRGRGEEVVDRSPDEGDNEVQGVDLYGLWVGGSGLAGGLILIVAATD